MIPAAAVFFLSCAALTYEVLLVRILRIVHDHHFAFMILSLALLGYGAGATALTLAQHLMGRRPRAAFAAAAVFLSWTVLLSPAALARLSFNPLEILWDRRQIGHLAALYLCLSVPFGAGGMALGLAFRCRPESTHRLYLADLCGAGLGAALAVGLLEVADPAGALRAASAVAVLSAVLCGIQPPEGRTAATALFCTPPRSLNDRPLEAPADGSGTTWRTIFSHTFWSGLRKKHVPRFQRLRSGNFVFWALLCAVAGSIIQLLVPSDALKPMPNPYKGLAYALKVPEARIVSERFGPMGWVAVVESPHVPFRSLSGWSLSCAAEPPSTPLGVFVDGAGPMPVFSKEAFPKGFGFRDCLLRTLPYRLAALHSRSAGEIRGLLLGLHGNLETVIARAEGASFLDVVERHGDAARTVTDHAWGLRPDEGPGRVSVDITDPRRFLRTTTHTYDVIHPAAVGTLSTAAVGGASLMEVYEATVEAFLIYLDRLSPQGFLALEHSLSVPAQATLRFVATAVEALKRRGVEHPSRHLAVIHDWNTALLLVKKAEISALEKQFIQKFCSSRSFDIAYLPGMIPEQSPRFHVSQDEPLHQAVSSLLSPGAGNFLKTYPFRIDPVTDNRPYAFHFFRWRTFNHVMRSQHGRGLSLLSWGYPVIMAAAVQATLAAALWIALPLALRRTASFRPSSRMAGKILVYFGSLGLAFLFIETVMIQKNVFLLGHPVSGFAGTVGPFLVWAGLGSLASQRWARRLEESRVARLGTPLAVTAVFTAVMVCVCGLAWIALVPWAHGLPAGFRWAFAVLGMAPAAFFMGMPMPLGLRAVARTHPDLVPWAWAVNGCASVVSALAAALAAMSWGFVAVLVAGAVFYGVAALRAPVSEKAKAVQIL